MVRRIYEAWNAGDPGLQQFDPAVEVHQTAGFLDTGGVFHGHEGVLASARELMHGLHDLHWETHDLMAAPCGQVVVPFTARATGRASKAPVEMSGLVHVWTIRDGLAIRMLTYEELSQALEAVGLRE